METTAELATSAVRFFERAMSSPIIGHGALARIGLDASGVKKALAASAPMSPEEVKRAMARQVRKGRTGRGGLPRYVVELMYADYRRLNSLSKVGALHGRTRQSIYDIFVNHGLAMNSRRFLRKIEHAGRSFTPGKDGYYRATSGDRKQLHHLLWEEAHGPIPEGHQVSFSNADRTDLRSGNLICQPIRDVTLFHHARHQLAKGRAA